MQRYPRPPKPADFESRMTRYRRKLRLEIEQGSKIAQFKSRPWRKYRERLCDAQRQKCGYCDNKVRGVSYGDVEHFRPKSAVSTLDTTPLRKGGRPIGCRCDDRPVLPVSDRGYWWLAFSWRNYLYACPTCNGEWKKTLFPVKGRPRPPSPKRPGRPLLLHPYEGCGPDPARHLRYRPDGTVEPRDGSDRGLATIWVCGLNRQDLVDARRHKTRQAWQLVRELERARGPARVRLVLRGFLELGQVNLPFSGVVRTVFEQNCRMTWGELEDEVRAWQSAAGSSHPAA